MVWLMSGHQESGFFVNRDPVVVLRLDIEINGVGASLAGIRRYSNDNGGFVVFGARHFDDALSDDFNTIHAFDRQRIALRLFGGIHNLQVIDVLDPAVVCPARKDRTIADNVHLERHSGCQRPDGTGNDGNQDSGVKNNPRAHDMGHHFFRREMLLQRIFGGVANETTRLADLVHDRITGIDTGSAADTLVLNTLPDIDTHRTDRHAQTAVDAIPQGIGINAFFARAARFAALRIIGDDQGIRIEHDALETRIRAHVFTNLLTQETGLHVAEATIEEDPEQFPAGKLKGQCRQQFAYWREIGDQRKSRPDRDQQPYCVLGRFQPELTCGQRPLVQLHACRTIALDLVLHPHEYFGIDGLRTRIAAEQATGNSREQEQGVSGNDQQQGQVENILRPQDQAKQIELALDQMQQNRLTTIPVKPGRSVKQNLSEPHQHPTPGIPPPLDFADIDFLVLLVKRDSSRGWLGGFFFGFHRGYIRIEITLPQHRFAELKRNFDTNQAGLI